MTCGRVRQSRVTPYVEVNVAGNWVDTSVALFIPVGHWLHFTRPTQTAKTDKLQGLQEVADL